MRRVLVVTWALGTASGVLLGLFGVQLVSSRFSTSRVSPMSHPEVLRALQAARSVPPAAEEVALPVTSVPDTANPPAPPPTDVAPARPSAGATSAPAQASPASALPRPGATAGTLVDAAAAAPPTTSTVTAPPESTTSSTTATTVKPDDSKAKSKSKNSSTTTTTSKKVTTTTTSPPQSSKGSTTSSGRSTTRTLSSRGGVVTVRFYDDGKVEIRSARPNAGYEMRVASNGPGEVVVYFWKQGRFSEVRASSRDGDPSTQVNEWECSGTYPNIRCRQG